VKRIDYYSAQQPWHSSKWFGVALGGFFGMILLGTGVLITHLTRTSPPNAASLAAGVATAPAVTAKAAPTAAPAATAPAPAITAAPSTDSRVAAVAAEDREESGREHKHHHRHHSSSSHKSAGKVASAPDQKQRDTVLAKHDSKEKRKEKDAIDKLLGL
jgi:hypothetical protein